MAASSVDFNTRDLDLDLANLAESPVPARVTVTSESDSDMSWTAELQNELGWDNSSAMILAHPYWQAVMQGHSGV